MKYAFGSLCLLISMITLGCQRAQPPAATTTSPAAAASAEITVTSPKKIALPRIIELPGVVVAENEAGIQARVPGYVVRVRADIGQRVEGPVLEFCPLTVRGGTILAELATPELLDMVRQKQALRARADAEVELAERARDVAEAGHGSAVAFVEVAKAGQRSTLATLKRWTSESTRIAKMVNDKLLTPQEGDEADRQLQTAKAANDESHAKVAVAEKLAEKAKAEWNRAKADVTAAESKRAVAEAEEAETQTMYSYRYLRAPFDGTVTHRKADIGQLISAKGDTLFTVARIDRVRIVVLVPETEAAVVRAGTKARVVIPALSANEIDCVVARTAESLDTESRTLRTEIDLPNSDRRMRPGAYVNVRLFADMPPSWVIPASAAIKQADITVCFLNQNGKATRTPIRTGRTDGTFTEVWQKQKPGTTEWEDWTGAESVISGPGAATLTDGQPTKLP